MNLDEQTYTEMKLTLAMTRLLTHPDIQTKPTVVIENVIKALKDEVRQQRKKEWRQM
jgi:hypothetical protein